MKPTNTVICSVVDLVRHRFDARTAGGSLVGAGELPGLGAAFVEKREQLRRSVRPHPVLSRSLACSRDARSPALAIGRLTSRLGSA